MIIFIVVNSTYKAQNLPRKAERTKNKKTHKYYEFWRNKCVFKWVSYCKKLGMLLKLLKVGENKTPRRLNRHEGAAGEVILCRDFFLFRDALIFQNYTKAEACLHKCIFKIKRKLYFYKNVTNNSFLFRWPLCLKDNWLN